MQKPCLFCNFSKKAFLQNDFFYAMFDEYPVSPGHTLIIPKSHTVSLFNLKNNQWNNLRKFLQETIQAIESANLQKLYEEIIKAAPTKKSPSFCKKMLSHTSINTKPAGYNIGINEGRAAGRTIDHLHIQIIPRYKNDVVNLVGGIRNIIPLLGDYTK